MKDEKIIFEGTELIRISDPGCGCDGCFFNQFENCSTPREKAGIGRCSLDSSVFVRKYSVEK